MIVGYRYIGARIGYGSTGNALQSLQAKRAGMAASLSTAQSNLSSITSSLANAQLDRVNGLASNAVQAAVDRIKASSASSLKKVEALQQQIAARSTTSSVNTVA